MCLVLQKFINTDVHVCYLLYVGIQPDYYFDYNGYECISVNVYLCTYVISATFCSLLCVYHNDIVIAWFEYYKMHTIDSQGKEIASSCIATEYICT